LRALIEIDEKSGRRTDGRTALTLWLRPPLSLLASRRVDPHINYSRIFFSRNPRRTNFSGPVHDSSHSFDLYVGMTGDEGADAGPIPTELTAATVNV
jgi:hypothetical protein